MPWLTENIISVFKNVYGLAGDEVKIVSDHDNVMIVQGKDGNRFPVNSKSLTYDESGIDRKPVTTFKNTKPAKSKKSATQQIEQSSLF